MPSRTDSERRARSEDAQDDVRDSRGWRVSSSRLRRRLATFANKPRPARPGQPDRLHQQRPRLRLPRLASAPARSSSSSPTRPASTESLTIQTAGGAPALADAPARSTRRPPPRSRSTSRPRRLHRRRPRKTGPAPRPPSATAVDPAGHGCTSAQPPSPAAAHAAAASRSGRRRPPPRAASARSSRPAAEHATLASCAIELACVQYLRACK